jgi:hypothetical protein
VRNLVRKVTVMSQHEKTPLTDEFLCSFEYLPLGVAIKHVDAHGYRALPIAETLTLPPYNGRDVIILRHTEGPDPHVTGARAGDPSQIQR